MNAAEAQERIERLRLADGDMVACYTHDPGLFAPEGLTDKNVWWVWLRPMEQLTVLGDADLRAMGLQRIGQVSR